jgi:uncharacterized membrane protein YphA (DoxX/SURF4 family)
MNLIHRLEHWGDTHHPKWIDLLRIALGIFLCFKGIEFAQNTGKLMSIMNNQIPFSSFMLILLSHYILFAHIMGGFMLAMGMLTRFAALIQIPVLLGAIIFVNSKSPMWGQFSELSLSILILLLLCYFLVVGGGRWSFDWYLDHSREAMKENRS